MVKIYTLPSCGICHMVKTKMQQKNIPFEEKDLTEDMERAPVVVTPDGLVMTSPSEIVQWINSWEG